MATRRHFLFVQKKLGKEMKCIFGRVVESRILVLLTFLIVPWLAASCGPSSDEIAAERGAAESECRQLASARSGYNPAKSSGDKSSVGKGAAIGAASGAAVGAITSDKSKKVVEGAAIGAAAGAGAGALKDKDDKKKAKQAASVYEAEFKHCMSGKGF